MPPGAHSTSIPSSGNPETPPSEGFTTSEHVDRVLSLISEHKRWTLGDFFLYLFDNKSSLSSATKTRITSFLAGNTKVSAEKIVDSIYNHAKSAPPQVRFQSTPDGQERLAAAAVARQKMARQKLEGWAVSVVEAMIWKEVEKVTSKDGGFHAPSHASTWNDVGTLPLHRLAASVDVECPTTVRVLRAMVHGEPSGETQAPVTAALTEQRGSLVEDLAGEGQSRKRKTTIIMFALMIVFSARNLHFSVFRRAMAIWLFANSASDTIFAVASRIGLSLSYSQTLASLRALSKATRNTLKETVKSKPFLVIYDNINRMKRAWDPQLGQRDKVESGTAAMVVELDDCNSEDAFNASSLEVTLAKQERRKLTLEVLEGRINYEKLNEALSLHALSFLAHDIDLDQVPIFRQHRQTISTQFRGPTVAIHRMRDNRQTRVHPLETSKHNEGTTEGNKGAIDDIFLRQLGFTKREAAEVLRIIGGDQSTVEKIGTLKRFMASCQHGYAAYKWIIPLIQLWHMGWADLERILMTHWGDREGGGAEGDISTYSFINGLLRRNIKKAKRPDFYPTRNFIFDTLKAEILDCWRVLLKAENLTAYFRSQPNHANDFELLLNQARHLIQTYTSSLGHLKALHGHSHPIPSGDPWTQTSTDAPNSDFRGDQVLANTILRMRDAIIHYEFQYAIADGDIGRAMNVMAVWTFTFAGAGKNKYANELLELACNFTWEYSDALKQAILNNWLCNLTGHPGSWFPLDLLQEHHIRQIKVMSQRRNADFGSNFMRNIISLNIKAFLNINKSLRQVLGLGQKSGSHHRKDTSASIRQLLSKMSERQLHLFRAGRTLGHCASNDFDKGYENYAGGRRIASFLARTLDGDSGDECDDVDDRPEADMDGIGLGPDDDVYLNSDTVIEEGMLYTDTFELDDT